MDSKLGLYVIFEGNEGTGKSSTMSAVAEHFRGNLNPKLTHHPGSTPLGAHLRKLVKFPHEIDKDIYIDPLTRQCLYMADTISFVENVLKPSLNVGQTVFADRSTFISGLVYGTADNVDPQEIYKLLQLIKPPLADRLYILQCPWYVTRQRINASRQNNQDHYDNQSDEFFQRVDKKYSELLTGTPEQLMMVSRVTHLDNVIYINADRPQQQVVDDIILDLESYINNLD